MFLQRLLKPGPTKAAAERLYAVTVAQAREPGLYTALGAPDTPDGRFEIYSLHVLLVLGRLRADGSQASSFAQAYFDAYLAGLDNGLRELAVGDLSVGKTMRKLGEAFYGRGKAMDAVLAELPDRAPLIQLIGRTVFSGSESADPGPLADYAIKLRDVLTQTPSEAVFEGQIAWPSVA
jgi:cytochrome b pre-mRNA-processing protein 3